MQHHKEYWFKYIVLWGAILLAYQYGRAQEQATLNWQLVKDKDAVKVYTATPKSGSLKYIKVEAVLNGTIPKFVDIFKNVPDQTQWVYKTKQAYILHSNTANDFLYYNETALPWPMSNRDVAIHMKIKEDSLHHQLVITSVGDPTAIPQKENRVRVPCFEGNWTVRAVGANKLQVAYYLNIDPGGTIPAWISNLFITKGPYETFINLAKQLRS